MASSYCAPIPARATSFIPRRASPFDASTSNCRQDSDCGSSSGLGGMKTQELASDEGGSSSSGAQAYNNGAAPTFMPRPNGLPFCIPPQMGGVAQQLPQWVAPTPPGASNDLFVHVQLGETLSVCIGNEMKNITGPATVRMVGESGISPHALPIQVPPGHLIHQIVDEQGILRHLILSPERPTSNYPPSVATPSSGCNRLVSPPPAMSYHNNFYTVQRPPHEKKYYSYHEESTEGEADVEEQERLKDMLSRIQPPKVVRVDATTADIEWEEIDTSEASAPGGPFPQIDRSEFIYHIVLFEGTGKFIANYPCDASAGNQMRLCELRPFTDYYVQLKASLEERGPVLGEPSQPVNFKTAPFRPEPPHVLKVSGKGVDWFSLTWRVNLDNGSPVTHYNLYLDKAGVTEKVWGGKSTEAKVSHLRPATTYHVRVTACNKMGESSEASVTVSTKSEGIPPPPNPPNVVLVSSRGVKLVWSTIPDFTYTLEQYDVANDIYTTVRERFPSSNIFIGDLAPGHQYRFRIKAHNVEGESSQWSDFVSARLAGGKPLPKLDDRIIIPTKPSIVSQMKTKTTIGWQCPGAKDREFEFHLEGSSYENPTKFRTLYKGSQMTYLLTDEDIQNLRVQSIKRGNYSAYSEVLVLPKEEEEDIVRPEQPAAPSVEKRAKGSLEIFWKPTSVSIPSTAKILYEVKRIDNKADLIYCGPETSCTISNLGNREHVEIQVRSVVVNRVGLRFESEWSPVAGGTAPVEAPPSPVDLHVNPDSCALCWRMPDSSIAVRYRVYCTELLEGAQECVFETVEPYYTLSRLGFARKYICRVSAVSSEGAEGESTVAIQCVTPSGVPAQPENISVEAESTTCLLLKWNAPECRGDPIQQYRIRIECKSEVTRDSNVLVPSQPNCEYRITDLRPDTRYRVEISAQNSVGNGVSAAISGKTKALPPAAPRLEAEAEPFLLKLKWKPEATHNFMTYRLVRLGENENQEVVYEGDQCVWKMKNLNENTEYRFQIRAMDKATGCGPWSEVYVFSTLLAQPSTIRQAPTTMPAGTGCYQIDWVPIIGKPNQRQCFYRLQAIDCVADDAKWHSVYEGLLTSHTMRVSDYPGALQVRVVVVRPRDDGREVVGSPSPVVYIANTQTKRKPSETEVELAPAAPKSPFGWMKFGSDKGITIISVMLFAVLSCSIALFFDQLYIRSPDT